MAGFLNWQIFDWKQKWLELRIEKARVQLSEENLRKTADRLQAILEHAPVGIVITSRKDGRLIEYNPAHLRMCGYSQEELKGTTFKQCTHPDDVARNVELFNQVASGALPSVEIEKRYVRKDGQVIWARVISSLLDKDCVIGIVEDITARKQAEAQLKATAERIRAILDNAPIGINIVDREGRVLETNPALSRIVGYSEEELIGRKFVEYTHPDDVEKNMDLHRGLDSGIQQTYELEKRFIRKGGSTIWARVRVSVLNRELRVSTVEDITERVLAQEQLRRTAERLQLILDRAPLGVAIAHYDGRLIETNPAFQHILGYAAEELRLKTVFEMTHPDDLAHSLAFLAGARTGTRPLDEIEKRFIRKDGQSVWVRVVGSVVDGEHHMGIVEDITGRKRAAEQLQRSETRVRRLIESNVVGVIIGRSDGSIAEANNAFLRMVSYTREDVERGLFWRDLTAPEYRSFAERDAEQMRQTGGFQPSEKEYIRKDGSRVPVMVGGTSAEGGETIAFVFDLTDRNRTRNELEQLARIVESADDAIVSLALNGTILSWNQGAERLFGYAAGDMIGKSEERILPLSRDDEVKAIREVIASGKGLDRLHTTRITRTGEEKLVSLTVSPMRDESGRIVGLAKIIRDRTTVLKAQQLEEQLRQAQKFEAIGLLAGGVAHDFNNLLTIISLYAHLLQDKLGENDELRNSTRRIVEASTRGAALTRKLLAFSRRQTLASRIVNLNEVVESTVEMVKRLIGEDIELTFLRSQQPCTVKSDPDQMGEALLNLCVNARDAMPEGGKLTIETDSVWLENIRDYPSLTPGQYARLVVADTGTGMTQEVQDRIFEPFFTTKEVGKGTGLGLAMVYGFVEQSGGCIRVISEPGHGTTFQLYFPAVEEKVGLHRIPEVKRTDGQGETILVVEDEDAVREVVVSHLKNQGYEVIQAANGAEGLQAASRYTGKIHLLLTDIIMPKMNGVQLAQALRKSRSEIAVVYMSGYADRTKEAAVEAAGILLEKPFSRQDLLERVRRAIHS